MSWREFIASLVGSLAWPVVVLVLVLALRRQVIGLLDGPLSRLKLGPGGVEAEWDLRLGEVAVSSARALSAPQGPGVEGELQAVEAMIDSTPVVAVRRCFDIVRRELRLIIEDRGIALDLGSTLGPPTSLLIRAAYDGGAITKETGEALRGLDTLVQMTDSDFGGTRTTPDIARDYLALTRATLFALDVGAPPSRK